MSFDTYHDLAYFVRRFLTSRGAEVEKTGSRFTALLPHKLAGELGIPEYCTLNLAGDSPEDVNLQYGHPALEKMADVACQSIPVTSLRVQFAYIKSQGFDNLIREQFSFINGIGRVESSAETLTDYLLLTCRYLLQSDEQKEDLVTLGFNLESGAPAEDIDALLDTVEKQPETGLSVTPIDADKLGRIVEWVHRRAPVVLEPHLCSFRDSMNRRLRRDVANLEEYYTSLQQEMEENIKRPGLSEEAILERAEKIGLISDELASKKEDLFKKYSITVGLRLCAAMLVRTPAVKVLYQVAVGREKKQLTFFYNPITKSIDPLICAGCGHGIYQIQFCRRLHLLCPKCAQSCPVCVV